MAPVRREELVLEAALLGEAELAFFLQVNVLAHSNVNPSELAAYGGLPGSLSWKLSSYAPIMLGRSGPQLLVQKRIRTHRLFA